MNSQNVLLADEWDTPGSLLLSMKAEKGVNLEDFLSQHNESRKFFPKLLYYLLATFSGLNIKHVIYARYLLLLLCSFMLYRISRKKKSSNKSILISGFMLSALIAHPSQALSHLTSIQVITIVPPFFIILFFYLKNDESPYKDISLYLLSCIISTFSFANGMLLWVLLFPSLFIGRNLSSKTKIIFSAITVLTFGACMCLYFIDYNSPGGHPSILDGLMKPVKSFRYFILWLGTPFAHSHVSASIVGSIIGFVSFAVFCLNVVLLFKRNRSFLKLSSVLLSSPWAILVFYALISGALASLGRSGFGVLQALSPQYPSMAIWFYIGIWGMFFSQSDGSDFAVNRFPKYALVVVCLLAYPSGIFEMNKWNQRFKEGVLTMKLNSLIPHNPLFKWNGEYGLYPGDQATSHPVRSQFDELLAAGLIDFETYDNKLLAKNLNDTADSPDGGCLSYVSHQTHTEFWGWASISKQGKPADFIIIVEDTNSTFIPVTGLLLNEEKKDISHHFQKFEFGDIWGFKKKIYEPTFYAKKFRAFAIDEKTLQAYPLTLLNYE
ncbi:hypothetical protein OAQ34_03555 [Opitutales bacterium]|nr:hypothetical protein [Opitutales bacterium]